MIYYFDYRHLFNINNTYLATFIHQKQFFSNLYVFPFSLEFKIQVKNKYVYSLLELTEEN